MSVNKVTLIGNVGKEPEIKHLESGQTVASFSLATTDNYKNKAGEKVSTTEWHNIVIWGKLAEIVEKWVTKGKQLYLEGKITTRTWEKDGVKNYRTEIVVDTMQMLGGGSGNESKPESGSAVQQRSEAAKEFDAVVTGDENGDDLPF